MGNDNGQLRVTLPWSWRGVLQVAGYTFTQGRDEMGKAVAH